MNLGWQRFRFADNCVEFEWWSNWVGGQTSQRKHGQPSVRIEQFEEVWKSTPFVVCRKSHISNVWMKRQPITSQLWDLFVACEEDEQLKLWHVGVWRDVKRRKWWRQMCKAIIRQCQYQGTREYFGPADIKPEADKNKKGDSKLHIVITTQKQNCRRVICVCTWPTKHDGSRQHTRTSFQRKAAEIWGESSSEPSWGWSGESRRWSNEAGKPTNKVQMVKKCHMRTAASSRHRVEGNGSETTEGNRIPRKSLEGQWRVNFPEATAEGASKKPQTTRSDFEDFLHSRSIMRWPTSREAEKFVFGLNQ